MMIDSTLGSRVDKFVTRKEHHVILRGGVLRDLKLKTSMTSVQMEKLAQIFQRFMPKDSHFESGMQEDDFYKCIGSKDLGQFFSKRLFYRVKNADDCVEFGDFAMLISILRPGALLSVKLALLFELLDLNGDGQWSRNEFLKTLKYSLEQNRILVQQAQLIYYSKQAFDVMDTNQNGHITSDEFEAALSPYPKFREIIALNVSWLTEPDWNWEVEEVAQNGEHLLLFLKSIAAEFDAPQETALLWKKTLEGHMYLDVDSLKDMTAHSCHQIGLPDRLYTAIFRKLCKQNSLALEFPYNAIGSGIRNSDVCINKAATQFQKRRRSFRTTMPLYFETHGRIMLGCFLYLCLFIPTVTFSYLKCAGWIDCGTNCATSLMGNQLCGARFAAGAIKVNAGIILFPVMYLLVGYLRRTRLESILPLNRNLETHIFLGLSIVVWAWVHSIIHAFDIYELTLLSVDDLHLIGLTGVTDQLTWDYVLFVYPAGISGFLLLVAFSVMFLTWLPCFRRRHFNMFFTIHHLYMFALPLLMFHGYPWVVAKEARSYAWIVGGLSLFIVMKLYSMKQRAPHLHITDVKFHTSKILEIRFEKPSGLKYHAGSWMYLKVPAVSRLEWHPFSITSSPDEPFISVHVQIVGDWTTNVADLVKDNLEVQELDEISGPETTPPKFLRSISALSPNRRSMRPDGIQRESAAIVPTIESLSSDIPTVGIAIVPSVISPRVPSARTNTVHPRISGIIEEKNQYLSNEEINILQSTWKEFNKLQSATPGLLYKRLFEISDAAEKLFKDVDMNKQSKKLLDMISASMDILSDVDNWMVELEAMGRRHANYGVNDAHFVSLREALFWTLEKVLGDTWTDEVEMAFDHFLSIVRSGMGRTMGETRPEKKRRIYFSDAEIDILQGTWKEVEKIPSTASAMFYDQLYEIPGSEALLEQTDTDRGSNMIDMISSTMDLLDDMKEFPSALESVSRRHASYGVTHAHFDPLREALFYTLEQIVKDAWTDEAKAAYGHFLSVVRSAMVEETDGAVSSYKIDISPHDSPMVEQPETPGLMTMPTNLWKTKNRIFCCMEGPITGAASEFVYYNYAVFIATGIGITPMASMLKDIWFRLRTQSAMSLKKVYLYWSFRDQNSCQWFDTVLQELTKDPEFFDLHLYLTSRKTNSLQMCGLEIMAALNDKVFDIVTGLRCNTTIGRPNFDEIFYDLSQKLSKQTTAVFFCGSPRVRSVVERMCYLHSDFSTDTMFVFKPQDDFA